MNGITSIGGPPAAGSQDSAKEAAEALEAYFLRQLLAEVRPVGGTLGGNGVGASTFQEMLEGALSDAMASGSPFGLAESIEAELERQGTVRNVPPPSAAGDEQAPRLTNAPLEMALDGTLTGASLEIEKSVIRPLKTASPGPSQPDGAK